MVKMEWRKPDDYPEEFEDVLIYYESNYNDFNYTIGWHNGREWRTYFCDLKKCLAWIPLPVLPDWVKNREEN